SCPSIPIRPPSTSKVARSPSAAVAASSARSTPSCIAFQASARYIAPVSMCRYPRRAARARATVPFPAPDGLFVLHRERIGDVVLVDVADVLHRLAADPSRGHPLHVVEPHVGIEAARLGFPAQLADPSGPRVVGREGEEPLVQPVHRLVG